ncbi:MAG: ECF transporter S component [Acidobacteria bacterium]|nr:ECF transporter S component [Acidobacteriota bacterium]
MPNTAIHEQAPATLPALGVRAVSIQAFLLLAAAFLLPAAFHAAGLPVRLLLPMHWPIILVGLCYGWRSGLIVGAAAPAVSFLISGHPLPHILPSMTFELAAYGALAGLFKQQIRLNGMLSAALAVIGGRLVFIAIVLSTAAVAQPFFEYAKAALLPGIPAAIAQIILLPLLATWWVRRESRGS